MTRILMVGIAALLGLLLIGRVQRATPVVVRDSIVAPPVHAAPERAVLAAVAPPPPADAPVGTPVIDLLARVEGHRRLVAAAPFTYLDSLFVETDSVVRRWANPSPLVVAILPDSGRGLDPALVARVQAALNVWENTGAGIRFRMASDTTGAQLVVRTIAKIGDSRVGETQLDWVPGGTIRAVLITLAKSDSAGHPLPPPIALAVAVHEVGHALGLAHSKLPGDVMFPITKSSRLSERDRATIAMLYSLPLGSVRIQTAP